MGACSFNRESLKKGIEDDVKKELYSSGLFNEQGFTHPDINSIESPLLRPSQTLGNILTGTDIKSQFYRDKLFKDYKDIPILGKLSLYSNEINRINDKYFADIISYDDENNITIKVPEDLINEYEYNTDEGYSAMVRDSSMRYVEMLGENSTDIITVDNYFQHPLVNTPTVESLLKLAFSINPDFKIGITDNLDKNGVAIISKGIILLKRNRLDAMGEELSHFIFELIPEDNKHKQELLKEVLNHSIYVETLDKYKDEKEYQNEDGSINYNKIKREAATKLLADFVNDSVKGTAEKKYRKRFNKLKTIVNRILNYIRQFIGTSDYRNSHIKRISSDLLTLAQLAGIDFNKHKGAEDMFFNNDTELYHEYSEKVKGMLAIVDDINKSTSKLFLTNIKNLKVKQDVEEIMNTSGISLAIITKNLMTVNNLIKNIKYSNTMDVHEEIEKNTELAAYIEQLTLILKSLESIPKNAAEFAKGISDLMNTNVKQMHNNVMKTPLQIFEETGFLDYNDKIYSAQDLLDMHSIFAYIRNNYNSYLNDIKEDFSKFGEFSYVDNFSRKGIFNAAEQFNKDILEYEISLNKIDASFRNIAVQAVTRFYWEKLSVANSKSLLEIDAVNKKADPLEIAFTKLKYDGVYNSYEDLKDSVKGIGNKSDSTFYDGVMGFLTTGLNYNDDILQILTSELVQARIDAAYKASETSNTIIGNVIDLGLSDSKRNEFNRLFLEDITLKSIDGKKDYKVRTIVTQYDMFRFKKDEKVLKDNLRKSNDDTREEALNKLEDFYIEHGGSRYKPEYYNLRKELRELNKILKKELDPKKYELVKTINQKYENNYVISQLQGFAESIENKEEIKGLVKVLIKMEQSKSPMNEASKIAYQRQSEIYETLYTTNKDATVMMYEVGQNSFENKYKQLFANARGGNSLSVTLKKMYSILKSSTRPTKEHTRRVNAEIEKAEAYNNILEPVLVRKTKESIDALSKKLKLYKVKNGDVISYNLLTDPDALNSIETLNRNSKQFRRLKSLQLKFLKMVVASDALPQEEKEMFQMMLYMDFDNSIKRLIDEELDYYATLYKVGKKNVLDVESSILSYFFNTKSSNIQDLLKNHIENKDFESNLLDYKVIPSFDVTIERNVNGVFEPVTIKIDVKNKDYSFVIGNTVEEQEMYREVRENYEKEKNLINKELKDSSDNYFAERTEFLQNDYLQEIITALLTSADLMQSYAINNNLPVAPEIYEVIRMFEDLNLDSNNNIKVDDFQKLLVRPSVVKLINDIVKNKALSTSVFNTGSNKDVIDSLSLIFSTFLKTHPTVTITSSDENGILSYKSIVKIPLIFTKSAPSDPVNNEIVYSKELQISEINKNLIYTQQELVTYANASEDDTDTLKPNVNMNGEFLPTSSLEYINPKFKDIVNNPEAYKYYKVLTKAYWKEQLKNSYKGSSNMDTMMPIVTKDNAEKWQTLPTTVVENLKTIKSIFIKNNTDQITGTADMETIEVNAGEVSLTKSDTDYKRGILYSTKRLIDIEYLTFDLFAAILEYVGDSEDVEAKRKLLPTFQSIRETLNNNIRYGGNVNRVDQIDKTLSNEFYGQLSQDTLTQSFIGKAVNKALHYASNTLLFDLAGGFIEGTGGLIQNVLKITDTSETKEGILLSGKALAMAIKMRKDISFDNFNTGDKQKSKSYLLVKFFGLLPNDFKDKDRTSRVKQYVGVRDMGMKLRTTPSQVNDIMSQIKILLTKKVTGATGTIYDMTEIYEIDTTTGFLKLIQDVEDVPELYKQWNTKNGTKVGQLRVLLAQTKANVLGNNSKFTKSGGSYSLLGKITLFMKGWLYSTLLKGRFGKLKINDLGEETTEGKYLTGFRLLYTYTQLKKTQPDLTIGKYVKFLYSNDLASFERRQMINAVKEISIIILSYLLIGILGFDDDDEDRMEKVQDMHYFQQLAIMLAMRLNQETSVFTPIPGPKAFGASELLNTFVDPFRVIRTSSTKFSSLIKTSFSAAGYSLGIDDDKGLEDKDVFYQRDAGFFYSEKGDPKIISALLKFYGYEAVPRLISPLKTIRVIDGTR